MSVEEFDNGGWMRDGVRLATNTTGEPIPVPTLDQLGASE